jgi:uncharacterized membrane protein YedE/YeeE
MSAIGLPVWQSVAGGALIGGAASLLWLGNGRIAGISGITDRVLNGALGEQGWHVAFMVGLVLPALVVGTGPALLPGSPPVLAIAGLLVGYGTRVAAGCTSGHGVCGISNLSGRSLVATLTSILVAALTVSVRNLLVPAQ